MTPQPQYHAGLCGIKDWERGLPSHSWCLYPQPHRNQEWLPWRIPHPHLCAPKTCIRGSVGDQQGPGEGRWQSGIKGGPLRSGLLGQRRDAPPPPCPGQLLPRSQGLKPEPLCGGGAAALAWDGSRSWGEAGFQGAGVSETQALPALTALTVLTVLPRLAALGKVTHQLVMCLGRRWPAGLAKEAPTPPGAQDPQLRVGAKPHPMRPSPGGLIFSKEGVPIRVRSGAPNTRPDFGKCHPRPGNFRDPRDAPQLRVQNFGDTFSASSNRRSRTSGIPRATSDS